MVNRSVCDLRNIIPGQIVVDIGCGYGRNQEQVERLGGRWVGVERYRGGKATIFADGELLPLRSGSADLVVMDSVLEHIPDPFRAVEEAARILKPGGHLIGYVAFMECYHEISFMHLSFSAVEYLAERSKLKLEKLGGGLRFGIDYHLAVLLYPLPFDFCRGIIASLIRAFLRAKSWMAFLMLLARRHVPWTEAWKQANLYFVIECLRQSNGFNFLIRKPMG